MQNVLCICICRYVRVYIQIYFLAWSTRESGSSNTLIPMSVSSTQILVSKYPSPVKETRVPWRNGRFQAWGKERTNESETFYYDRKLETAQRTMEKFKKTQKPA